MLTKQAKREREKKNIAMFLLRLNIYMLGAIRKGGHDLNL
jgi:hypothetical protein